MTAPWRISTQYQVFISSTFSDLHAERQAVTLEVLAARHIPSGMESFPATDDRGWQTIQRTIDMADYYVLLLAGRYGTVDPTTDLSWTEREYEYAKSKGIPVLAFVRERGSTTADKMEEAAELQDRIASFVKNVRASHLYKEWRQVDDLKGSVVHALTQHIADDEDGGNPRPGWYRGTDMPSAQIADELARLSAENADLRQRLEAAVVVDHPKVIVTVETSSSDYESWPVRITVENPGTLAVADLDIRVTIPGAIDLRYSENRADRVSPMVLAGELAAHRESVRLDKKHHLLSGVVDLLRPGERRLWGTGYASFPSPGEYELRVAIKARNLSPPLDEVLSVTVGDEPSRATRS